jgi:fused signal recognition particle receptor
VLDATTGQNAIAQARSFAEALGVTGIILTKLDGTARGGVVIAVRKEVGVPIRYIGIGEGIDDLRPFDPQRFAEALFEGEDGNTRNVRFP